MAEPKLIAEKLDIAADALKGLFHAVSNLPVPQNATQAKDDIKVEVARVAAMIDAIREQIKAEKSNGHT
jgi:hypothetical protein